MLKLSGGNPAGAEPRRELSPQEIVAELDRYIVGQREAKRSVAVAVRNRNLAFETEAVTGYLPAAGTPSYYAGSDMLQRSPRAASALARVKEWTTLARELSLVSDWAIETNRVAPR